MFSLKELVLFCSLATAATLPHSLFPRIQGKSCICPGQMYYKICDHNNVIACGIIGKECRWNFVSRGPVVGCHELLLLYTKLIMIQAESCDATATKAKQKCTENAKLKGIWSECK